MADVTVKPDAAALVCVGVAAFIVAGVLLRLESDQRGNALLMWLTGALFMLDKAYAWPASPLIMIGEWFGWLYAITQWVVLLRYPVGPTVGHSPAHRVGDRVRTCDLSVCRRADIPSG